MDILAGVKVVDVSTLAFVPSAGGVMAHWGADVIKVEPPDAPDPLRFINGGTLEPGQMSWLFKHYSRGKRSVAIDLATDDGREVLYKLVADADVFLTNYLPRVRRKLKVDVDDIRAINPNIVYARGSGHGPKGPDAERPGFDWLSWWSRGSLAQSAADECGRDWPTIMVGHGDGMSGMTLAGGICAALVKRALSGRPSVVDASLLGTAVWFNGMAVIPAQFEPVAREFGPATPPAKRATLPATMNYYQTKDYRFLHMLFRGDYDAHFVDFCEHIDRIDLLADARFTTTADRADNNASLMAVLDGIFVSKTLDEWKTVLATTKGAWGPVQTPEEIYDDPQTVANKFVGYVEYPGGGLLVPAPPILFDEEAGDPPPAPDFAADTDDVLREHGLSDEDIGRLRASGVIR